MTDVKELLSRLHRWSLRCEFTALRRQTICNEIISILSVPVAKRSAHELPCRSWLDVAVLALEAATLASATPYDAASELRQKVSEQTKSLSYPSPEVLHEAARLGKKFSDGLISYRETKLLHELYSRYPDLPRGPA